MAETGIFTNNAEVLRKAGANASAVATDEAFTNDFILQAENYINARTLNNWTTGFASLKAWTKGILKEAASSLAAIYVINYDMSGYSSRMEPLIMINLLWARVEECLKQLDKEANRDFVRTGSI